MISFGAISIGKSRQVQFRQFGFERGQISTGNVADDLYTGTSIHGPGEARKALKIGLIAAFAEMGLAFNCGNDMDASASIC